MLAYLEGKAREMWFPLCKSMISTEAVSWLHHEPAQQKAWNTVMCITRTAGIRILHWHKKTNISLNNWLQMGSEMSWSSNAFSKTTLIILRTRIFISKRISSFLCLLHALETHLQVTFSLPALQAWKFCFLCSMTGPTRTWKITQNWDIVIHLQHRCLISDSL